MGARTAPEKYACLLVTLLLSCPLLPLPAGGGRVEEFSSGLSSVELSFPTGGGEHTVHVKLPAWSYAMATSLTIRGEKIPNEKSLLHTTDADFGTGQLVNATTGLDSIQRATHVTTLLPMRAHAAGRSPHYVAIGDVNGDGKNDVAVTNYYSNTTGVFLQGTGGSLAPMLSLDVGAFPNGVAIADISGDGRKDIAVAAVRLDGTGYVALFNQTQTGGLGPRDELPAGPFPDGCAIGDVTGDGRPDIVVANWAGGSVGVFQQRPGGGFYPMVPYSVGTGPRGVAIGDVNNDGRSDIVVAVSNDNRTAVFYQAQDGQLQLPPLLLDAGHLPVGVALGDLDANGRTDIVVACSRSNETGVYFQKPDGTLQAMARCAGTGAQPWMVSTGDLNGDGRTDYAVSNYATGANVVDVLAQDILNVLRPLQNLATDATPDGVAIGDVTGDGLDDVVVANRAADTVGVFEQRPFTGEYVSTAAVVQYNIVSARAVWAERPAGEPVRVSLSNDNGEHWTAAANGSDVVFTTSGTKLRYRVEFVSATALTEILVNYTLETLYPSDLRLDVGADGELEWERQGLLTETVELPDFSEAVSRYVAAHFLDIDPDGNISVPLLFMSRTAGILNVSGVSIEYNIPPEIQEFMPRDSPVVINEGQSVRFSVTARDRDGDELAFVWLLDGAPVLEGEPSLNYTADHSSAGCHTVTASVSDGRSNTSRTWDLRVRNVNRPPELTGIEPAEPPAIKEGERVLFKATAQDPDGEAVTVEWVLDGAVVNRSGEGESTYEYRAWYTDAGEHNLTVSASDGELKTLHSWAFTVLDINPLTDLGLTRPAQDVAIREGEEAVFSADLEALQTLLGNLTLRWTYDLQVVSTAPAFTLATDYTSSGNHTLTLTATLAGAGGLRFVRTWRVTVEEVTDPPAIQSFFPLSDPIIREGMELEFRVSASDPDNDTLSHSWRLNGTEVSTAPSYLFKAAFGSAGVYNVTVVVSDGRVTISHGWTLTVLKGSRAAAGGEGQGLMFGIVAAVVVLAAVGGGLFYAWSRRERLSAALDRLEREPEEAAPVPEAKPEAPPEPAPPPKKKATYPCPSCGGEVEEDWFLCHHCSAPLKAAELAPAAAASGAGALEARATEEAMMRAARRVEALECPSCGKALKPSDERCPGCGAEVQRPAAAGVCPGCGKPVESGWIKCPECGEELAAPGGPAGPDTGAGGGIGAGAPGAAPPPQPPSSPSSAQPAPAPPTAPPPPSPSSVEPSIPAPPPPPSPSLPPPPIPAAAPAQPPAEAPGEASAEGAEAPPIPSRCPGCGTEIESGWVKCPECGAELVK